MTNTKDYKSFIDRVQKNISYHSRKNSNGNLSISVNFLIGGDDKVILNEASVNNVSQLKSLADYHQPDKILIRFFNDKDIKVFDHDFNIDKEDEMKATSDIETPIALNGFQGLGQVSVDEYINKKLEEDRTQRRLQELQKELNDKNSELNSLSDELSKANESIDRLEEEKENLNQIIESKQTVRYWAGLTGDILESIGIKKEALKEPLAGLVSSEATDNTQIQEANIQTDESGFTEASPEQSQRDEIITLIKDFLLTLDNQKLSEVFIILSEIEQKKEFPSEIINHFNLKN